jgi:glycosyltransferase involved in cell wall biosynthesis
VNQLGNGQPVADVEPGAGAAAPGVTVAIPNWNHELLLARSVGSALRAVRLLRSRGVPGEVLVVDDASRDGSIVLLRQMEAMHYGDGLRVLALGRNGGLAATRNAALREASHRYVVFMDADNELLPENLYHFYRAICDTGAAGVYGNLLSRRRDSGNVAVLSNESFQDRMTEHNYIDAFGVFDRPQLLDCGGYSDSPGVRSREDWELYLHLAACGRKVVFVPLVFGFYHDLPGSMIKQSADSEAAQNRYVTRVFDQLGARGRLPLNTRHLRYHPDVGYI